MECIIQYRSSSITTTSCYEDLSEAAVGLGVVLLGYVAMKDSNIYDDGERTGHSRQVLKVLVVDDDPDVCNVVARGFEAFGCPASAATTAFEALELVKKYDFGLVVVDVIMPGQDGLSLMEKLKNIKPELPVVVYSGKARMEMAVDAFRAGAADFIEKQQIFNQLEQLIEKYSSLNRDTGDKVDPKKFSEARKELEKSAIIAALERTRWNQKQAAKLLDMSYSTFRRRMKKYGLL